VSKPLHDPDLPSLVSAALEMRDQGLVPPLEEICRQRPDLIEAVRASLATSERLPSLQRKAAGQDRHVGRVLDDRYQLDGRIGAGAMGVVYRARDLELDRWVALKVLRSTLIEGQEAELRFAREARALAAVHHAAVVTIHDRGRTAEDDPYLVMELLEGQPLSHLLEEGRRRDAPTRSQDTAWIAQALGCERLDEPSYLRTVVGWAADLAAGLNAAHEKGIFHRDVKPSNVFIRADGAPVLLDFGIAAQADQAAVTREGVPVGTPAYMAPESLGPERPISAALDVYGLCATLYHLLTQCAPYRGTPSQVLAALATRDPVPARRLREGMPRDLIAVLDRGLARDPGARYASCAELEADLRAFLDYRPVKARPLAPGVRTWRRLRRSPTLRATAAVGLLALAITGAVLWRSAWQRQRQVAFAEVWSHLPPNRSFARVANRRLSPEEGRDEVEALLDRAVELCRNPIPAVLEQAFFRLDHGDGPGAGLDMARVADAVDTDYARQLAARYRGLPRRDQDAPALDLADLPEPATADDLYLAAYHLFREVRYAEARPLLEDELLADYLPAQDLLCVLLEKEPERMYRIATWIEERQGHRSATSALRLGNALGLLADYREGLAVLEQGLELAPNNTTLLESAGHCAWRLQEYDRGRAHFERAIELKPHYLGGYERLTRLLISAGLADEAAWLLSAGPFDADDAARCKRATLRGDLETERALQRYLDGEAEAAAAGARRALESYAEADGLGRRKDSARARISAALAAGESAPVFDALLDLLKRDPLDWRRMQILAQWMPDDPTQEQAQRLADFLLRASNALVPRRNTGSHR
jgi:serine/threonine protein kinase/tetratricopeptide (TPR) repeat protein